MSRPGTAACEACVARSPGARIRGSIARHWNAAEDDAGVRLRAGAFAPPAGRLHFETFLYHPQLPELATLARRCPEARIVLNHLGTPLGSGRYVNMNRVEEQWRAGLADVAGCSNVVLKIGGLPCPGTIVDAIRRRHRVARWTADRLAEAMAPWLSHALACFGPSRCLFESNFPFDGTYCSYGVLVDAYRRALGGLPAAAQDAIFYGTARRVYQL